MVVIGTRRDCRPGASVRPKITALMAKDEK